MKALILATQVYAVATDACNDVTVTYSDDPGQGSCAGQSASFGYGQRQMPAVIIHLVPQLIEIFDTTAPDWTCPDDMTVECTK